MRISLIVALTRGGVIGKNGGLPWRLSDDLKRFKQLTTGHCLIMGRKTLDSLGRLLPGRTTIVLTRQPGYQPPFECEGALIAKSLDEAIAKASGDSETFIIGGGEIFAAALPRVARMYVTWVEGEITGDTHFPAVDWSRWRATEEERFPADAKNEYETTFAVYDRLFTGTAVVDDDAPADPGEPVIPLPATEPILSVIPVPETPSVAPKAVPMPETSPVAQQLLDLNQKLLVAIVGGDWKTYEQLCDPSITCFEPEARGQVVAGMAFHKFYFDLPSDPPDGKKPVKKNVTMAQPHVRVMGDAAVLSYIRLTQGLDASGAPQTARAEETRVWQKINGEWKHVHFHRVVG